jgi:CheY-like chemotaxis protein
VAVLNLLVRHDLSVALTRVSHHVSVRPARRGPGPQELLVSTLQDAGYGVVVASSGSRALEVLEGKEADSIRALVTDIRLAASPPTGWEIARRAREVHPDLPVVYVTGDGAADWPSQGVPNSIIITKPFAPAQIVTAVSQLLNALPATPPTA